MNRSEDLTTPMRGPTRAFTARLLGLVLIVIAAAPGCWGQSNDAKKLIEKMERLQGQIQALDAKLDVARAELDKEKLATQRVHLAAFDTEKQSQIGEALSKALAGHVGDAADKSPAEIFDPLRPTFVELFGEMIVRAAEKEVLNGIALLIDEPTDPTALRAARIIDETFGAAFGRNFESAWPKLAAHTDTSVRIRALEAERDALKREFDELQALRKSDFKGNIPRGMVVVPGTKAPVELGIDAAEIETYSKAYGETLHQNQEILLNSAREATTVDTFLLDRNEVTMRAYWYFCVQTGRESTPGYFRNVSGPRQKQIWVPIWPDNEIPEGWDRHPVCYVKYEDAQDYCEWTGCRLPTEDEFEYASRSSATGYDGRIWPWGDQYEKAFSNDATSHELEARKNLRIPTDLDLPATLPVGSFPRGQSPLGIFDLAGNVAEWTSDPFVPRPTMKPVAVGEKEWNRNHTYFNPNAVAVRGGHSDSRLLFASSIVRVPGSPAQPYKFVGFRRARSGTPGKDALERMKRGNRLDVRLQDFRLTDTDTDRKVDRKMAAITDDPKGYAILEKLEWNEEYKVPGPQSLVLIANRDMRDMRTPDEFFREAGKEDKEVPDDKKDLQESILIGMFHTDVPVIEPALSAGTWFVAYKNKYKIRDPDSKSKRIEVPAAYIFYNLRPGIEPVRVLDNGRNTFKWSGGDTQIRMRSTDDADWLECIWAHPTGKGSSGIETMLPMKYAKGALADFQ